MEGNRLEARVLSLIAVVLVLVIISFVLFPGSSNLRWGILVLVLIAFGLAIFASLYRTGIRIPPLELPDGSDSTSRGDLPRLSEILRKAEKGMRYSQGAVVVRVREAFLARLQAERNLEPEELASILASPRDLDRMVGDPDIQAFLEDTSRHEDSLLANIPDRFPAFRFAQEDFIQGLSRIVRSMEAWR